MTIMTWSVPNSKLTPFLQAAVDKGWSIISVAPYKLYGSQQKYTTEYFTTVERWLVVGSK